MNSLNIADVKPLVVGSGKLSNNIKNFLESIGIAVNSFELNGEFADKLDGNLAIVVCEEILDKKIEIIQKLEKCVSPDCIVAINTESIHMDEITNHVSQARRILGLNWSYPVEHSFFLEIIGHSKVEIEYIEYLKSFAVEFLGKDPYVCSNGFSVRGRLISAMAREAFFMVENNFANIESIDRSCRNDAGYYMSFAGNFRYMDLMGTAVYGIVMETLNGDLASQVELSQYFQRYKEQNFQESHHPKFYIYSKGEEEKWEKISKEFAEKIRSLMETYPITFNY